MGDNASGTYSPRKPVCVIPQRIVLTVMSCWAIVITYKIRTFFSLALSVIVRPERAYPNSLSLIRHIKCNDTSSYNSFEMNLLKSVSWSEETQGYILSSFYIGYLITHVPGAMFAERFGGKWVLNGGMLGAIVSTALIPIVMDRGGDERALFVLRMLVGLGQGTMYPAMSTLLANWLPIAERARLGALVLSGGAIGTVMGFLMTGYLLQNYHWHVIFYLYALHGFVWIVVFSVMCYNDPYEHPFIGNEELAYLDREIGRSTQEIRLRPWRAIFTNMPVIAMIIAQLGHDWALYVAVVDLPKYIYEVIRLSIFHTGISNALPFGIMWIMTLIVGYITDHLHNSKIFSLTQLRKANTVLAAVLSGIFMFVASFYDHDATLAIAHFCIGMGFMGLYFSGAKLNPLDLSPNYAGTLTALSNGMGVLSAVLAPISVGWMTNNAHPDEWQRVFLLALVIQVLAAAFYLIWGDATIQDFDRIEQGDANE